jgi:hypothetical protein
MRNRFLLSLLAVLIAGCASNATDVNKNNQKPNPTQTATIIGTWNWHHSIGGFVFDTLTPQGEFGGYSLMITEQNTYQVLLPGVTSPMVSTYTVDMQPHGQQDSLKMIHFKSQFSTRDGLVVPYTNSYIHLVGTDTLILENWGADVYTEWYVRAKE